jgi:hypothetical protein
MIPYVLLFLLASFLFFIPSNEKPGIGFYVFLIVAILFSGLRDMIGGYDVYIYAEVYEIPTSQIMKFPTFEIGFRWFYYLLRQISDNRYFMFFICAVLIMASHFFTVKKHSPIIYFSLFILFCKFFLMSFVYLRQGIAMGIIWFSIGYILKKDFLRFGFLIILAFLFHKSAIIFLPIYFIANIKFNQLNMFVVTLCALVISVSPLTSFFMTLISDNIDNDRIAVYVSKSGGINIFYLIEAVLLIYLLLKFRTQFYKTQKGTLILNGLFLYILINIMSLTNASFVRFGWFYFIFLVLAIPYIYNFIKQIEIKKVFKLGVYVYYSLLFFRLLIVYDDGDFMPYKSIFQEFNRNSQWEFMDKR